MQKCAESSAHQMVLHGSAIVRFMKAEDPLPRLRLFGCNPVSGGHFPFLRFRKIGGLPGRWVWELYAMLFLLIELGLMRR